MTQNINNKDNNIFTYQQIAVESFLIFIILALYGFWPVPDVNEQYYIGKAIHFWNPDWLGNDPFLKTPDSHWFFYATFGLLARLFPPVALAWFGRLTAWLLTAWAWQRLSRTLVPVRWVAVATVAGLLFFLDAFHLAGEWLVGGIEGKGFAFPLVFWGLALFCEKKYARAWLALGLASAFHVLVGGWTVLALLPVWLVTTWFSVTEHRWRNLALGIKAMLPGLLGGGLLALAGLLPALALDTNASAKTVAAAHQIYVFVRLPHHLVPSLLPWTFPVRFLLLVAVTLLLARLSFRTIAPGGGTGIMSGDMTHSDILTKADPGPCLPLRRFFLFVLMALAIAVAGLAIDYGSLFLVDRGWMPDRKWTADLLRFYFFRLSDWVVPAGLTFLAANLFVRLWSVRPAITFMQLAKFLLTAVFFFILAKYMFEKISLGIAQSQTTNPILPVPPRPVTAIAFLSTIVLLEVYTLFSYKWSRGRRVAGEVSNDVSREAGYKANLLLLTTILFLAAPGYYACGQLNTKTSPLLCRSEPPKASIAAGWRATCDWIRKETPPDALFLTPRDVDSFKWCARRAQFGSWKEMPQDARSIVLWYKNMENLYTMPNDTSSTRWNQPLVVVLLTKGKHQVYEECRARGISWIVAEAPPWYLTVNPQVAERWEAFQADTVWSNDQYTVIHIPSDESTGQ